MANSTTTPTPTTKTAPKKDEKKRPLIFDRPEKFSEAWIDRELIIKIAIILGKESSGRRSDLLAVIKLLYPNPEAQHWVLEQTVVEAAIRKGDKKMAALRELAKRCKMPTLRVRSNGEIIARTDRAVELLTAVAKSGNPRLSTSWREMRALLVNAGFPAKQFVGISNTARALEKKRQTESLDRAVEGRRDDHRGKKSQGRRGKKK